MDNKIFTVGAVLALISMLLGLAACGEETTPTPTADNQEIILVTFTSPEKGIEGVAPEGWVETMPAEFYRGMPDDDLAMLQHQFVPEITREQLLAAFVIQEGLEQIPEVVGKVETADFSWDLYTVEMAVPGTGMTSVDFALAEANGGVYSVVLQVMPNEYAALHDTVFIPAVEAAAPVDVPEDSSADRATIPIPERTYWPTNGWRTSSPEKQGMDSALLAEMWAYVQEHAVLINSVTIIRHGYLVWEATSPGYEDHAMHDIYSCTKSITSALVGIAIDHGYIESVDQPVLSFFQGRTVANVDGRKEGMRLEHLLTMTDGLNWGETGISTEKAQAADSLQEMEQSQDWVQSTLDRQMATEPGTRWNYNTGAAHLLSAIIQETTGVTALAFAEEHLFGPLGISEVNWLADPQGRSYGGTHLLMAPYDMAKLGYLYLNEGQWDGQQIVPAAWVDVSTMSYSSTPLGGDYGYLWWVMPWGGYYTAMGAHGQYIVVSPELDMVVVFTSNLTTEDQLVPLLLLEFYVFPAVES